MRRFTPGLLTSGQTALAIIIRSLGLERPQHDDECHPAQPSPYRVKRVPPLEALGPAVARPW